MAAAFQSSTSYTQQAHLGLCPFICSISFHPLHKPKSNRYYYPLHFTDRKAVVQRHKVLHAPEDKSFLGICSCNGVTPFHKVYGEPGISQILRHRAKYQRHSSPNLNSLCCGCGISSWLRMARGWQMEPYCLEHLGWVSSAWAALGQVNSLPWASNTQISTCYWVLPWCCHFSLFAGLTWLEHYCLRSVILRHIPLFTQYNIIKKKKFPKSIIWSELKVYLKSVC